MVNVYFSSFLHPHLSFRIFSWNQKRLTVIFEQFPKNANFGWENETTHNLNNLPKFQNSYSAYLRI